MDAECIQQKPYIVRRDNRENGMSYTINTPCGPLLGTSCEHRDIIAFKGIRYATAHRFAYPVPVTHWEGVYDATGYGNCCYQPRAFYDEENIAEKAFYYNEFRRGETYTYSEDCLFLNIWTPEYAVAGGKLPVIVYIHGGGFTGGCGHERHFDGPVWPVKGVIAVTINYRLGPLGFVCLPELSGEAGHTGNYGLFDQVAALQWVQHNIASFGGDAANVTVMGQSAGAMSVQQLCLSPLTDGLFARAVMSSGGGVSRLMKEAPADSRYDFWKAVMRHAGCDTLEQFRALSAESLFSSWQSVKASDSKSAMAAAPCLDGVLLTESGTKTVAAGGQKNIPYLIGTTSEDMMPPILFTMGRNWCRTQSREGRLPGYAWFFDRKLPGDENGAWHSSDLWYWFGTLWHSWRPFTEKDRKLSEQMTDYLTNFAKTGDPNNGSLPVWEAVTDVQKKVMRLGEGDTGMGSVHISKLIYTMFTNKAVGE